MPVKITLAQSNSFGFKARGTGTWVFVEKTGHHWNRSTLGTEIYFVYFGALKRLNNPVTTKFFRQPKSPYRYTLVLLFLFISGGLSAQMLNLQFGASFSKLDSKISGRSTGFLNQNRIDPSCFIGLEYFQRKYWSISSNVGYVRKGGKEPYGTVDNNGNIIAVYTISDRFNYLSVNTSFNLKYPIKKRWIPFLSVGPRMDFLISHDHTFPYFDYPGTLQKRLYGLVVAAGIRCQFSKFQLGLRADRLIDFNNLASQGQETNKSKTSIISLTIGSKFR